MDKFDDKNVGRCCFFGHRQLIDDKDMLTDLVLKKIRSLIGRGFCEFFFGGYGEFDSLCYQAVATLKKEYPNIKTIFVEAYYNPLKTNKDHFFAQFDSIVYPEIEHKPKKFAILYRNQAIIDWSDFCVFYVKWSFGGACQALNYAVKSKKPHVNIATLDN